MTVASMKKAMDTETPVLWPVPDEIVERAIKGYAWSAKVVVVGTGPSTFASYCTKNSTGTPGSVYHENYDCAPIIGFELTIYWRARRPRAPDRPRRALLPPGSPQAPRRAALSVHRILL